MSRLKELTEYKNTIITRILDNQNIVKALYYKEDNFLDKAQIDDFDSLLFSNIYPYNFIPTDEKDIGQTKAYITLSITDYRKAGGVYFNAGNMFISTFMHKSLMRTAYGFLRTDYLASEIHDLMDKKNGIGIGKLEYIGAKEFSVNSDYHGISLQYRPVSFN